MREKELQRIVSDYLAMLKDVVQSIRLFLYSLPITGTLSRRGFSMSMVFLRHRPIAESEESLTRYWFLTQT